MSMEMSMVILMAGIGISNTKVNKLTNICAFSGDTKICYARDAYAMHLKMGTWPKDSIFSLGRMDSRTCFQNCNSTGNSNQSVNNKRQETEKVCNRGEKEVSNINTGGMVD